MLILTGSMADEDTLEELLLQREFPTAVMLCDFYTHEREEVTFLTQGELTSFVIGCAAGSFPNVLKKALAANAQWCKPNGD